MAGRVGNYGDLKREKGVEKQASGRQPRRAAFWKAQPIHNK
jgi:hypothetical protein